MNSFKVEVLNPKATKLLKDLAELKLITISDSQDTSFTKILKRLRSKTAPTFEEITNEVETVRAKRNGK